MKKISILKFVLRRIRLSARTVYGASVIFANIQISFPHHVSAIRLGSPGNKYVSLIVPGRPIRGTTISAVLKGRQRDKRKKILITRCNR